MELTSFNCAANCDTLLYSSGTAVSDIYFLDYTLVLCVPTGCNIRHFPWQIVIGHGVWWNWATSLEFMPLECISEGLLWSCFYCLSASMNSWCSFTWYFCRYLIKLVILYDAAQRPTLGMLALHTLQVAVLLFCVLRLKYLRIKDMLS